MSRMSRSSARAAVASGLVLAVAAPVVVPAVASAAPAGASSTSTKIVRSYSIPVDAGVLAQGNTVKARVVISNPQSSVKRFYSRATIAKVVRKGINGKYEMPYRSQGFRVTPTVNGQTVTFIGKLRGADVPTTVKLKFSARYPG
jgi:hypothetical protein